MQDSCPSYRRGGGQPPSSGEQNALVWTLAFAESLQKQEKGAVQKELSVDGIAIKQPTIQIPKRERKVENGKETGVGSNSRTIRPYDGGKEKDRRKSL